MSDTSTAPIARPSAVVFDVNETLSDMSPMAARFTDIGAPGQLAAPWFAGLLRDGFALTVTGANPAFADLAQDSLRTLLAGKVDDIDAAVEHVMGGFTSLSLHPDVAPGTSDLADLGLRLTTLSNGSASVAEGLLRRAGVVDRFERLLSVEDAPAWKPAGSSYAYALGELGIEPAQAVLVAVHPWDIHGAHEAGLMTAWIDRAGSPYPACFAPSDLTVAGLQELATRLGELPTAQ